MIYEKIRQTYNGDLANMLLEVIDTAQDAIITIDENQTIVLFNQTASHIFGFLPEEMLGKNLGELLPEYVRNIHQEYIKKFDEEHPDQNSSSIIHALNRKELHGLRKDGEEFPCEISISKSIFKGNKYFTAIVRDISIRVQQEEKIRLQEDELAKYRIAKKAELIDQLQKVKSKSAEIK